MKKSKNSISIPSDYLPQIAGIHMQPEFLQFTLWFATPRQYREPETQKEFSFLIGVCEDTLTDWKRHPQFWPLVQQAMSEWIKDRIPDVVGGLYNKAVFKGNLKEVEAFMRLGRIGITTQKINDYYEYSKNNLAD